MEKNIANPGLKSSYTSKLKEICFSWPIFVYFFGYLKMTAVTDAGYILLGFSVHCIKNYSINNVN